MRPVAVVVICASVRPSRRPSLRSRRRHGERIKVAAEITPYVLYIYIYIYIKIYKYKKAQTPKLQNLQKYKIDLYI